MSRKHKHEDHQNHEAWAIPYADLMTLLLAFFVVMYAVSSVNEGKYRVLSDSLSEAFGGPPRSMKPMQMGKIAKEGESPTQQSPANIVRFNSPIRPIITPVTPPPHGGDPGSQAKARAQRELAKLGEALVQALGDLIDKDLITVRRGPMWLEVELKTDIYFDSGSALPNAKAVETMQRMAVALHPFPNPIRIEGYTDNVPISTFQFPSNWELSSARAASVVHVFVEHGITPERMAITGFSDQRAKASNDSVEGRAANRRVLLVIMALPADPALDPSRMDSSASNTHADAGGMGRS